MSKGVCVQKSPYAVELEAGDHYWCSCGLSKKQPFCDGSHKGSEFTPVKFTLDKKETKNIVPRTTSGGESIKACCAYRRKTVA